MPSNVTLDDDHRIAYDGGEGEGRVTRTLTQAGNFVKEAGEARLQILNILLDNSDKATPEMKTQWEEEVLDIRKLLKVTKANIDNRRAERDANAALDAYLAAAGGKRKRKTKRKTRQKKRKTRRKKH